MSERQKEHRLRDAYERVLERMQHGADELSWENLQKDLDEAVEFEAELEEFTRDEMALLRAWVERDLKDLRGYLAAGGSGVASWLGIDLDVLSRKVTDALFSVADRSIIEREQLVDDLEASRADYVAGEIAAPGRMACVHCGAKVVLESVTRLEPCHQCGHRYFERASEA
ncbi:Zinc-ribbon containing domain-containing protein [Modicisalibacter ilicicola DSM 19980]|uniref:Zinc-ribbon containing domain-containing protein n=1 Tax=Modicisalibacter ilicicola DSM 19980 TaxID=1121942 RepID=A0A1M4X2E7_9GAMM|nr:zinc ribbon-containing protein [Halomonas ilicicola]SHE87655.1 Zinc-ribbon containing domain-containing protein [Halomonas ilicicola DSM 19980]